MTAATMKNAYDKNRWLRRLGKFGFIFFFVKGLLWLVAPLLFYYLV